jgi:hypothetical protein
MPEQIDRGANPHQEAEELLPWYATGRLEPDEVAVVEQHLSSCAHCRRQLAFEHRLEAEFAAASPEADAGWERLKHRLQTPPLPTARAARRWSAFRDSGRKTFGRPVFVAIAAAQLAFLAITGTLLFSLSQPSYRALGSAPAPQSANVIVMFRGDTSEAQFRTLLDGNDATLVGGPTPADAYLLRVAPASRTAILSRLQADRHVVMAQPIDGATS